MLDTIHAGVPSSKALSFRAGLDDPVQVWSGTLQMMMVTSRRLEQQRIRGIARYIETLKREVNRVELQVVNLQEESAEERKHKKRIVERYRRT